MKQHPFKHHLSLHSLALPCTPLSSSLLIFFSFFTFHFSLFTSLSAQPISELERLVVNTHRESAMQHGMLAVSVYNITQNKPVYNYNSQLSLAPGSVNKILTTGVGFAWLGRDFRFTTRLRIRGTVDRDGVLHGDVYIIGGGDPLLGSFRYRQTSVDSLFEGWMMALKRKGIHRIDGRVCYHQGIFDEVPLHDSWPWGDVGNYYGAGVYGLSFHENLYIAHFDPGAKVGDSAVAVRTVPKNIDVHEVCEVTTGPAKSGDQVIAYGSPTTTERIYRGTVPLGEKDFAVRIALPNPAKQCADLFSLYLRTHGISVSSNSMKIDAQPDSLRTVLDYYSTDYNTIAQYTNITSNNIYAEAIFKYLGYAKYGKGTFANGTKAVMEWLKEKKIDTDGVRIVDGSGLSPLDRVTTDFLCRYLTALSREPFFDDFYHTLAVAGESGTAKKIKIPVEGVSVHLKTGTISGVKALAGYVDAANGDRLAFAIISNGHTCRSSVVTEKLTKILQKIASLY